MSAIVDPKYQDANGEFDAKKFVTELRKAGAQAKLLRNLRPSWVDLADSLEEFRLVGNSLILDGDEDRKFSPRGLLLAKAGSRAFNDSELLAQSALNESNSFLLATLRDYLVSLSDHLWAMSTLLRADPPLRPLISTGRVLLGASAKIRYILEPGNDVTVRTSRVANLTLEAIREELLDLEDTDVTERENLNTRKSEILIKGEEDQIERAKSKKGVLQDSFIPRILKEGDMVNLVFGGNSGRDAWRITSSVIHAQDRSLIRVVSGRGELDLSGDGLAEYMGAIFLAPSLVAAVYSYKYAAEYLGLETEVFTSKANEAIITIQAISGEFDDQLLSNHSAKGQVTTR